MIRDRLIEIALLDTLTCRRSAVLRAGFISSRAKNRVTFARFRNLDSDSGLVDVAPLKIRHLAPRALRAARLAARARLRFKCID